MSDTTKKKSLRERLLEGIASFKGEAAQMSAEDRALLAAAEAAVKDEKDAEPGQGGIVTLLPMRAEAIDFSQNEAFQSLKRQNDQLQTSVAQLTSDLAAQKAGAQLKTDEARVDALVRGLKMTSAEGKTWKALAKDNPTAFAASFATQESRPVMPQLRGGDNIKARTELGGDPAAELSRLTAERSKKENISYGEAAKQIAAEHPDLAAAHSANTASTNGEGE